MNMGKRLKGLRQDKNLTLKEAGAVLGVSLNSVYRWEHDLAVPRKEMLNKMADIYQVSLKWLLYGVNGEEGYIVMHPDEEFEQNLLKICRRLPENSRYKVLGYAERMWIEEMEGDQMSICKQYEAERC